MSDPRFVVNREELAWAAGFFDGEGCFSYTEKAGYATVTIGQVDRRVLDRFQEAVGGVGKIYGPYTTRSPSRLSKKPQYQYRAHRRAAEQSIAAMLWFMLGPVKRDQARRVLTRLARRCGRGHPLVQARGCPTCVADAWAGKRVIARSSQSSLPDL